MLRRVRLDKDPVSQSAAAFGFSRPTYYQAEADFQRAGLFGLLPEKRGPHQAHKLTADILISRPNFAQAILRCAFGTWRLPFRTASP